MLALLLRLLAVPVSAFIVSFSKVPQSLVRTRAPAMFLDPDLDLSNDVFLEDFVSMQRRMDALLNETDALLDRYEFPPASSALDLGEQSLLQRSSLPEIGSLHELRSSSDELSVEETETGYTFTLCAPGVKAGDLHVNVEDGMLTVAGEMSRCQSNSQFRSSFSRSMPLPRDADADVLSTTYADGTLVVALSKATPPFDEGDEPHGREAISEAGQLAAENRRFAGWLRAHGGHLGMQADAEGEELPDEPEL